MSTCVYLSKSLITQARVIDDSFKLASIKFVKSIRDQGSNNGGDIINFIDCVTIELWIFHMRFSSH